LGEGEKVKKRKGARSADLKPSGSQGAKVEYLFVVRRGGGLTSKVMRKMVIGLSNRKAIKKSRNGGKS